MGKTSGILDTIVSSDVLIGILFAAFSVSLGHHMIVFKAPDWLFYVPYGFVLLMFVGRLWQWWRLCRPKAIKTEDTDSTTRKLIENDETAEQILHLISEGEIIRAEELILSSVYGPLYEGDQELILAMKTQAFIELFKERNKDDEQRSAISEFRQSIADFESGMQNLTPKIKQKVQRALLLSLCTNLWSSEHAYLLKEDERAKVADLIKGVFDAYFASKKCIFDVLKKAKEA